MDGTLSAEEQMRCVGALVYAVASGVGETLPQSDIFEALVDILIHARWPAPHIVAVCGLDRRLHGRTTDPGGVDGPPHCRPRSENQDGIDPEAGARQGSDDDLGIPPGRYLVP